MDLHQIILASICGILGVVLFLIAYRQSKEKGFIFTNRWLYATKAERETMSEAVKKREYHLAKNVFLTLGIVFFLLSVYILTLNIILLYIMGALIAFVIVYAIVKTIKNETTK